ncbi:14608_t:CDS:2, partial [Dentiscutata heterogama]
NLYNEKSYQIWETCIREKFAKGLQIYYWVWGFKVRIGSLGVKCSYDCGYYCKERKKGGERLENWLNKKNDVMRQSHSR